MKYEAVEPMSHEQAEAIASSSDVRALSNAIIALAIYDGDRDRTAAFCLRHATHPDPNVRGCAMTGLGHLSRRFRGFSDPAAIASALTQALSDRDASVRGHADDAADEFEHFAGGQIRRV